MGAHVHWPLDEYAPATLDEAAVGGGNRETLPGGPPPVEAAAAASPSDDPLYQAIADPSHDIIPTLFRPRRHG